ASDTQWRSTMPNWIKFFGLSAMAAAAVATAGPAFASPDCLSGPRSEWRSMEDAVAAVTAKGYQVRETEIDDGCYEIKAIGKEGERVKFYVNPKSLEVVRNTRR